MPQFVLRHGSFYAREGEGAWLLAPTPTGHERGVHEIAAFADLPEPDCLFNLYLFEQALTHSDDDGPELWEASVALPCEVRLPKVKPKQAKKEVSA